MGTNIDMGAYEYASTTTWTGVADQNWKNLSNWTDGIPTAVTNAIIPNVTTNNYPRIDTFYLNYTYTAQNLEIQSGATLTIANGFPLTIEGNLKLNGGLTINSNATSNGSLILKGNHLGSGKVTYNRHVSDKWHLVTPPVIGANIANMTLTTDITLSGSKYAIAPYNNTNALATSRYEYYTTANLNSAGSFTTTKGYAVKKDTQGDLVFKGTLNTTDVQAAITDVSVTGNKWNLVGNPFTASINLNSNADATNNFLSINTAQLDPARVAAYVWNAASNSYDIINQTTTGAKYIAAGQGFFVEAKNGGDTLDFTEAMQSHQTRNVFSRNAAPSTPSIKLMVSDGKASKNTNIKYYANATDGLDLGYDAGVFSGEATNFNVFTRLVSNDNTTNFAIQTLPNTNYEKKTIPVGVQVKENTTITFSVEAENLPKDVNVYLEDKKNNQFIDLNKENYKLTLNKTKSTTGRFYLHTSAKNKADLAPYTTSELTVFTTQNNTLKVVTKELNEQVSLKMFNVLGKQVFTKSFTSKGSNEFALPKLNAGVYIVNVKTNTNKQVSKKIILK